MKGNSIRKALGMTQQAMATLLNVNLSQLAMYECGQRSLPHHAAKLLTALTLDVHSGKLDSAREEFKKEQSIMRYDRLQRMLTEMEYKHAVLLKNKEALARRQEENEKLFRAAQLVARYRDDKNVMPEWPLVTPKLPSEKERKQCEAKLLDYELELESLELKKLIVQSRIRSLARTLGFTGSDGKEENVS